MKRILTIILILCAVLVFIPRYAGAQTNDGYFRQEGIASWYGTEFDGRPTASGEIFNSTLFTAAHPSLPFGTLLNVINTQNNKSVTVKVNDRGPFVSARIIDVSQAAAEQLDMISTGTAPVIIQSLDKIAAPSPAAGGTDLWSVPASTQADQQPAPAVQDVPDQAAPTVAAAPAEPQPAPAVQQPDTTAQQPAPVDTAAQPAPANASQTVQPVQPAPVQAPARVELTPAAPKPPEPVPDQTQQTAAPIAPVAPVAQPPAPVAAPQPVTPVQPAPAVIPPPPPVQPSVPDVTPPAPPAPPVVQPVRYSRATLTPDITPVSAKKYRLQVGSYKVARNAVDSFDKLKSAGLNPAYERFGDFFRVVLPGVSGDQVYSITETLGSAGFREVLIREER
ncbi:MAG: septal ring lytic transglycosylase RlpA family protein [Treponema sp.]|nr:septal ring lytic transglycosylase RlpA family protein [Treponema sp.]